MSAPSDTSTPTPVYFYVGAGVAAASRLIIGSLHTYAIAGSMAAMYFHANWLFGGMQKIPLLPSLLESLGESGPAVGVAILPGLGALAGHFALTRSFSYVAFLVGAVGGLAGMLLLEKMNSKAAST